MGNMIAGIYEGIRNRACNNEISGRYVAELKREHIMSKNKETLVAVGLLLLRLAFGCFMLVHGWQKLSGFAEMADKFPDPIGIGSKLSLILAIGAEFRCSLFIIAGIATRLSAIPLAFTMIVALFVVHGGDPWQKKELAACYLAVNATLMLTGAGRFSVDQCV